MGTVKGIQLTLARGALKPGGVRTRQEGETHTHTHTSAHSASGGANQQGSTGSKDGLSHRSHVNNGPSVPTKEESSAAIRPALGIGAHGAGVWGEVRAWVGLSLDHRQVKGPVAQDDPILEMRISASARRTEPHVPVG